MLEDARKGIINLILVKDLSQLGRDYVEVGRYAEVLNSAAAGKGVAPTPIRLRPMAWRRRMSPVNSYGLV